MGKDAGKETGREVILPCWTWISWALALFGSRQKSCWAQLSFKEVLLHLLYGKIVTKGKKRVSWLCRERRQGLFLFLSCPLSGRQAQAVTWDSLGSAPSQGCSSGTAGTAQQNSAPTWRIPPGPAAPAGISSQVYLARGHPKFCPASLVQGSFWRQLVCHTDEYFGSLKCSTSLADGTHRSPKSWLNVCWKAGMPRGSMKEKTAAQPHVQIIQNYPKLSMQWGKPGKPLLKITQFLVLPMPRLPLGSPLPAFSIPIFPFFWS